jgi:DNA-binding response OmpR family regulator
LVLIVEDDALLASSLASFMMEECDVKRASPPVPTAEAALVDYVDFAVLDVDVIGGNTYHLARRLCRERVRSPSSLAAIPPARIAVAPPSAMARLRPSC